MISNEKATRLLQAVRVNERNTITERLAQAVDTVDSMCFSCPTTANKVSAVFENLLEQLDKEELPDLSIDIAAETIERTKTDACDTEEKKTRAIKTFSNSQG